MKFYIAAAYANKDTARLLGEMVEQHGHEVTCKWYDRPLTTMVDLPHEDWLAQDVVKSIHSKDSVGVLQCDVFVLIFTDDVYGGLVELGMADAWDKLIIGVGEPRKSAMLAGVSVWCDEEEFENWIYEGCE